MRLTIAFALMALIAEAAAPPGEPVSTGILGRVTDRRATLSVHAPAAVEAFVEYGDRPAHLVSKTTVASIEAGEVAEFDLVELEPDSTVHYRLRTREPGKTAFATGPECAFQTQRKSGEAFTFALQGDSHPERVGRMFDADLYRQTLANVAGDDPDFYILMGDDFSLEPLIRRDALSQEKVDAVYVNQRRYLETVGATAPLFLVNGNHEQATLHHLDGTPENAAVLAGRARNRLFPLPAPDDFYTGDREEVEHVGLPRDYYAWTWGDALFVVIDPYWHTTVPVGSGAERRGGRRTRGKRRDLWDITLGDTQYHWLGETLEESEATFKFVFTHHVLGTGRGGIEMAGLCEWGGRNRRGNWEFDEKRPDWDLPIHQLFVKTGVTILFQAHDHLFARQELDGVVYQSVPNPADPTGTAFNRESYLSGDIFPNSGHLRVNVAPDGVQVDYVRSAEKGNGDVVFSYRVPADRPKGK